MIGFVRDLISIVRPNVPPIFFDALLEYPSRQGLDRPWIADGRLWASDRRLLVWAWLDTLNLSGREHRLYAAGDREVPDVATLIRDYWHHPIPVKLPATRRWVPCPECKGTARSSHDPDYPCYDCEGTGLWRNYDTAKVGDSDVWLMGYFIGLLREHGVDRVLIPLDPEWPVRFDLGPISGLLMPCRPPHSYEIEAEKNRDRAG